MEYFLPAENSRSTCNESGWRTRALHTGRWNFPRPSSGFKKMIVTNKIQTFWPFTWVFLKARDAWNLSPTPWWASRHCLVFLRPAQPRDPSCCLGHYYLNTLDNTCDVKYHCCQTLTTKTMTILIVDKNVDHLTLAMLKVTKTSW